MSSLPITKQDEVEGWKAELELGFFASQGASRLGFRRHVGPLRVQRPFYPEGRDTCHVYLLHPPGGLVGSDDLHITTKVEGQAHALMTTPGATKVYRNYSAARLSQNLKISGNGILEWFPQETIAFNGAQFEARTRVDLGAQGQAMGWDILCLGRPASGERFKRGYISQRTEIYRQGKPLFIDHLNIRGGGAGQSGAWGLRGLPVVGTFWFAAEDEKLLAALRKKIRTSPDELYGVTQLQGLVVCRYLGQSTERARELLTKAWTIVRPRLIGKHACMPRIWNT